MTVSHTRAVPPQPADAAGVPVLQVEGLTKEYRLFAHPRDRLKALLTGRQYHRSHWALRDVDFTLHRGQCLGVIGDNGAGKSSLLKLLAGTTQPSRGRLRRVGRVTAILELGAGFHPDFSGRDNLYFAGSLIGIEPAAMARLEAEILAFAELGDAIERPVKTYSSGMVVRLAFALVTAVQPDVLIIDEALAVGDQHFQKKCVERITAFKNNGCTILFCSHSPYHIRTLCDVALWLDAGRLQAFGATEEVLGAYETHARLKEAAPLANQAVSAEGTTTVHPGAPTTFTGPANTAPNRPDAGSLAAHIVSVTVDHLDAAGDPPLLQSRDLVATITVRGHGTERPNIGFMIEQSRGTGITSLATHEEGAQPQPVGDPAEGLWRSVLAFPDLPLHTGEYVISAFLFDATGLIVYDEWLRFQHLRFVSPTLMPGLVRLPHTWR